MGNRSISRLARRLPRLRVAGMIPADSNHPEAVQENLAAKERESD